ncbi:MAG: Kelch repeat-containing protein [Bacillota bacterium]
MKPAKTLLAFLFALSCLNGRASAAPHNLGVQVQEIFVSPCSPVTFSIQGLANDRALKNHLEKSNFSLELFSPDGIDTYVPGKELIYSGKTVTFHPEEGLGRYKTYAAVLNFGGKTTPQGLLPVVDVFEGALVLADGTEIAGKWPFQKGDLVRQVYKDGVLRLIRHPAPNQLVTLISTGSAAGECTTLSVMNEVEASVLLPAVITISCTDDYGNPATRFSLTVETDSPEALVCETGDEAVGGAVRQFLISSSRAGAVLVTARSVDSQYGTEAIATARIVFSPGPPEQLELISLESCADGSTAVTIGVSDRFGNPVQDGTVVTFAIAGGSFAHGDDTVAATVESGKVTLELRDTGTGRITAAGFGLTLDLPGNDNYFTWHLLSAHDPNGPLVVQPAADIDLANNRVLFNGGFTAGKTASIYWFDLDGREWVFRRMKSDDPIIYGGHTVALDQETGSLYSFGGYRSWPRYTLYRYDPETDSFLIVLNYTTKARQNHAMFWDPERNLLVVYGGLHISEVLGDVFCMDVATKNRWPVEIEGDTPGARHRHAGVMVDGKAYIHGGLAPGHVPARAELWELDTKSPEWRWTRLSSEGPSARYGHVMTYVPSLGALLVYGGHDGRQFLGDMWLYYLDESRWQQVEPEGPSPGPRIPYYMGYADGKVILIGGVSSEGCINDVWILEVSR